MSQGDARMKPPPWSFSSLSDFHNCPKAYYEKKVARSVEDPPNDGGLAGDYIHKSFEFYLKDGTPLPTTYPDNIRTWPEGLKPAAKYKDYLDKIKASSGKLHIERKYAINKSFESVDFESPDAWCRAIIDILHINGDKARILDHKSGKRKMDYKTGKLDKRQLKLCALLVFIHHPKVNSVKTGYVWLKDMKIDADEYLREETGEMWEEFQLLLTPFKVAFKQEIFAARKSGLCNGWCPVTTCEHWKPKRRK